jgi:hypothetical protein
MLMSGSELTTDEGVGLYAIISRYLCQLHVYNDRINDPERPMAKVWVGSTVRSAYAEFIICAPVT